VFRLDRSLSISLAICFFSLAILMWFESAHASDQTFLGHSTADWAGQLSADNPLDRDAAVKALGVLRAVRELQVALAHDDPVIRYWAAVELGHIGQSGEMSALTTALGDDVPYVRIAAAEAMCRLGQPALGVPVLATLLEHPLNTVRLAAISSLESIGSQAIAVRDAIDRATGDSDRYVVRIATRLGQRLAAANGDGR